MRVGILGAGNISATHARAARALPGVDVVAVCGRTMASAQTLASEAGAVAYDDLDGFLAHRPMDLVAIGTPSGLHAEHAIAAVRRGLHVLVEKPLDIATARIDALAAEADRAQVTVGVCFQDRLAPDIVRAKRIMDAGKLGAPVLASGHVNWYRDPMYYAQSRWRGTWQFDGGGALMNQGIHTVDLLMWLFGRVARVASQVATRMHAIEVEDTATAVLEFAGGALGVLQVSTAVFPGYARRLEVTGTEGTLVIEHDRLVRADLRTPVALERAQPAPDAASAVSPVVSDLAPHRRLFEDFIDAIRTGRAPACDAREGRRSVELIEAIYASARTGRSVAIG